MKANEARRRKRKLSAGLDARGLNRQSARMIRPRLIITALLLSLAVQAFAETKKTTKGKSKDKPAATKPKPSPAPAPPPAPKPQPPPAQSAAKLESFIMLPEPKAMRTDLSRLLPDAKKTVISPARETTETPGVKVYSDDEFKKLGISVETFLERSRTAADRRLATIVPDYVKDADGRLRYAVYRGDSPLIASLLVAPSLGQLFQKTFSGDVWAVLPDRNSLFIFPARPDALAEFTVDLRDRFDSNPFAASPEIFLLKPDGKLPRVVGAFGD